MIRFASLYRGIFAAVAVSFIAILPPGLVGGAEAGDAQRGKYLFDAAGCANCHTDRRKKGPLLGGGAPIKSPFGTFYGPNISPHKTFGIGAWSESDFIRAMRAGVSPDGRHYYPSFPYGSFTLMTDRDLKDLWAHMLTVPPVARPSRRHELNFPFNIRWGVWLWKVLYLSKGPYVPEPGRSQSWNRGAYLVEAVTHCGECHTPRTALGGLRRKLWLGGNADGPEGERVPNITPDLKTGIGRWSFDEIVDSLESGSLPDGDEFGSLMADVVEYGTSKLTDDDRRAIAEYLKSLKPVVFQPSAKPKAASGTR
ncbi:MAG: cytochrome c [Alphaproteobacteria bacterium]|nr:cytochrome c [Alphaproteobacteria bacterium]